MDGIIDQNDRLGLAAQVHPARIAGPAFGGIGPADLVGVIRNPRSHRNKGLVPEMGDRPNVLTRVPATRDELAENLAEFAKRGISLLAVDGGDGTVRDVLTCGASSFGANWPGLIVLPKGKTNALAVDLGLPKHWSLAEALEAARTGSVVERRPVVVDFPGGPHGQVTGFILGAGMFNIATSAGQTAHRFGAFNSLAVGVTTVFGILQAMFGIGPSPWRKCWKFRIFAGADGTELPHSGHGDIDMRYALLISTLTNFPLGMKLFGRHKSGLKYLLVDAPLRRVAITSPFVMAGLDRPWLAGLGVHRGKLEQTVMEVQDNFIMDGEAFPPGRYNLQMGPALKFIAP